MADNLKKMPDVVVIANAGFPGDNNFTILREVMKPAAPILEIYRNCGMALRMNSAAVQERVAAYLAFVRQAGREIALTRRVSPETAEELARELFSVDECIGLITPSA